MNLPQIKDELSHQMIRCAGHFNTMSQKLRTAQSLEDLKAILTDEWVSEVQAICQTLDEVDVHVDKDLAGTPARYYFGVEEEDDSEHP